MRHYNLLMLLLWVAAALAGLFYVEGIPAAPSTPTRAASVHDVPVADAGRR